MTKIVIIGCGNVGSALAEAIRQSSTLELAGVLCRGFTEIPEADLYLIAVPDAAVEAVATKLPPGCAVAHTAGSVSVETLTGFDRRGVLYPLQTFTKGRPVDFHSVPLLVESTFPKLFDVAAALSNRVIHADSTQRVQAHLAAVFACNFTNHLYAIAADILTEKNLSFDLLTPLITETAAKAVASGDPRSVQTGPAIRHDTPTLDRHRSMLTGLPRELYDLFTNDIQNRLWEISKKI